MTTTIKRPLPASILETTEGRRLATARHSRCSRSEKPAMPSSPQR